MSTFDFRSQLTAVTYAELPEHLNSLIARYRKEAAGGNITTALEINSEAIKSFTGHSGARITWDLLHTDRASYYLACGNETQAFNTAERVVRSSLTASPYYITALDLQLPALLKDKKYSEVIDTIKILQDLSQDSSLPIVDVLQWRLLKITAYNALNDEKGFNSEFVALRKFLNTLEAKAARHNDLSAHDTDPDQLVDIYLQAASCFFCINRPAYAIDFAKKGQRHSDSSSKRNSYTDAKLAYILAESHLKGDIGEVVKYSLEEKRYIEKILEQPINDNHHKLYKYTLFNCNYRLASYLFHMSTSDHRLAHSLDILKLTNDTCEQTKEHFGQDSLQYCLIAFTRAHMHHKQGNYNLAEKESEEIVGIILHKLNRGLNFIITDSSISCKDLCTLLQSTAANKDHPEFDNEQHQLLEVYCETQLLIIGNIKKQNPNLNFEYEVDKINKCFDILCGIASRANIDKIKALVERRERLIDDLLKTQELGEEY